MAAMHGAATATIDPLAPLPDGQYCDELVTVTSAAVQLPTTDVKVACTKHFELWRRGWQLVLRHRVPDCSIDDSLTTVINDELFVPVGSVEIRCSKASSPVSS